MLPEVGWKRGGMAVWCHPFGVCACTSTDVGGTGTGSAYPAGVRQFRDLPIVVLTAGAPADRVDPRLYWYDRRSAPALCRKSGRAIGRAGIACAVTCPGRPSPRSARSDQTARPSAAHTPATGSVLPCLAVLTPWIGAPDGPAAAPRVTISECQVNQPTSTKGNASIATPMAQSSLPKRGVPDG